MINDWLVQFYQFALFVLCGVVVASVYKVFCFFHKNATIKLVLDVIFGILLIVVVVATSYVYLLGQFRIYFVLGIVFGAYLGVQTLYTPLDNIKEFLYNQFVKRGRTDESNFQK